MVALDTLKHLAAQKTKDADVLFRNGRNGGAIYLMGYALEFTLKRKISQTLAFNKGFPETSAELHAYSDQISRFHALNIENLPTQIKQIKTHRLNELLNFSGAREQIISQYYRQWRLVGNWNPEHRYVRQRFTKNKTEAFINAARQILKEIS